MMCLSLATDISVKTHKQVAWRENENPPIAKKISFTFMAVFAEVSMNRRPLSSAYDWAS